MRMFWPDLELISLYIFILIYIHYTYSCLTLSGPRFFRYCFWKLVGRLLYMHICYHLILLKKFSVLRVLGLKKASKFDLFQKFQKLKSSFLNIFQKFPQKWTPHTLLTLVEIIFRYHKFFFVFWDPPTNKMKMSRMRCWVSK